MLSKKYRLRYLPLFYEDPDEKVTYIPEKLKNPKAANDLLDNVEAAIMERLPVAESFEPYYSIWERRYAYYRIYVHDYTIYYTVRDDNPNDLIMEVRNCDEITHDNYLSQVISSQFLRRFLKIEDEYDVQCKISKETLWNKVEKCTNLLHHLPMNYVD